MKASIIFEGARGVVDVDVGEIRDRDPDEIGETDRRLSRARR